MTYSAIELLPLTQTLEAEIGGVDLAGPLSIVQVDELHRALRSGFRVTVAGDATQRLKTTCRRLSATRPAEYPPGRADAMIARNAIPIGLDVLDLGVVDIASQPLLGGILKSCLSS